jgi:hypothetical protein
VIRFAKGAFWFVVWVGGFYLVLWLITHLVLLLDTAYHAP